MSIVLFVYYTSLALLSSFTNVSCFSSYLVFDQTTNKVTFHLTVKGCQNVFLYKQGMCHICMSPMCIQHKPAHTSPARNDISGGSGQAWLCSQSVRCCCRWGSLRLPLQLQPLQPIRRPFLVLTHPPLATYCPAA